MKTMDNLINKALSHYNKILHVENKNWNILDFSSIDVPHKYFSVGNKYEFFNEEKKYKNSYYDLIIISMRLYRTWHFEDLLLDAFALLKPGAYLIVDCPFVYKLQDDLDYWRISPKALARTLGDAGFNQGSINLWDDVLTSGLVRKPF